MISFKELSDDCAESLSAELRLDINPSDDEYFDDAVASFLEMTEDDPDTGIGISSYAGCLLVRIFDYGRYLFLYPIAMREDASIEEAIDAIRRYAIREELPLVLTDVPREELTMLFGKYRHLTLDAEDVEAESYRVEIHGECEILREIPDASYERVTINSPTPEDIPEIARLARDESVNKYWGYNYLADIGEVADEFFYDSAMRAFNEGVSMSMAVRYEGRYVGEVEYYAFDLLGGAEIAIRLLPEWQGVGLGKETLTLAIKLGRRIGLRRLYATVMEENIPSIKFTSSLMKEYKREGGNVHFVKEL